MSDLTKQELSAYKLLFEEHLPATEVAKKLEGQGYNTTPEKLRAFKTTIHSKMDREIRQERMFENMLESFDRTKLEFEDSVKRLKDWIILLEEKGDYQGAMSANRDLLGQINIALKVLGKINDQMINIKARNVNVISSTDFVEAFKKILYSYFNDYNAEIRENKLVFNKPSAEIVDDFHRWEAEKAREKATAVEVDK